jgi:hypothetical protein
MGYLRLVAHLLISGSKRDDCSFVPWRGTAAATSGMRERLRAEHV